MYIKVTLDGPYWWHLPVLHVLKINSHNFTGAHVVFRVFENELTGYASAFRVVVEQTSIRHSVTKTLEMCVCLALRVSDCMHIKVTVTVHVCV
jgi:hypothetical protein